MKQYSKSIFTDKICKKVEILSFFRDASLDIDKGQTGFYL